MPGVILDPNTRPPCKGTKHEKNKVKVEPSLSDFFKNLKTPDIEHDALSVELLYRYYSMEALRTVPSFSSTKKILRTRDSMAREMLIFLYTKKGLPKNKRSTLSPESLEVILRVDCQSLPRVLTGSKYSDFDALFCCIDDVLHGRPAETNVSTIGPDQEQVDEYKDGVSEDKWDACLGDLVSEVLPEIINHGGGEGSSKDHTKMWEKDTIADDEGISTEDIVASFIDIETLTKEENATQEKDETKGVTDTRNSTDYKKENDNEGETETDEENNAELDRSCSIV